MVIAPDRNGEVAFRSSYEPLTSNCCLVSTMEIKSGAVIVIRQGGGALGDVTVLGEAKGIWRRFAGAGASIWGARRAAR